MVILSAINKFSGAPDYNDSKITLFVISCSSLRDFTDTAIITQYFF